MPSETDYLKTISRDLLDRLIAVAPDSLTGRELAEPYDGLDTAPIWLALGELYSLQLVVVVGGYDPGAMLDGQRFAAWPEHGELDRE